MIRRTLRHVEGADWSAETHRIEAQKLYVWDEEIELQKGFSSIYRKSVERLRN
jgi:hypothetical protein